ncbi:O-antigen ligase family protein [Maribacter algarum]|uniref:O-antigen ligase family protein n=1 Tax=Maribacter algarum (ex Zhang et al. 2020) TaxID=2578118 RepID=A0A5S3PVC0_9FLAO|nr:O-antigen ligase family protein [Maribacter algarum]TMM58951.1 O-antigen ligase family protein [Maribacter algarum]
MFLENVFGLERLEKTRIFLLVLLAFCMPLHQKWSTIVLLALVVVSLVSKKHKATFWSLPFLLPPILYLMIALSLLYSERMEFRYLEQRASLMAFPIIFSASRLTSKDRVKLFEYFVLGCALAVLICFGNAFYNSFSIIDGELIFKPVVNDAFSFMYSVVRDGNYFFSSHFSVFHQTTYFAIYLNTAIAIILAFSLWKKSKIHFILLLLFPLVIFQLSSKISLLICGLIYVVYGLSRIGNKVYKGLFVAIIFSIGTLFLLQNPRSKIMIETLFERGFTIEPSERYGYSLRLMSWDAALYVASKNPFLGVGVGDTQKELNAVYESKGYTQPLKEELNAHNQFLQIALVCGVVGVLIFIWLLWNLIRKSRLSNTPNNRLFNLLFLIMITLSFLFESVLNRFSGISFFFFFYYLIITQEERKTMVNGN